MVATQSPVDWILQYILKPLWQILLFVLISCGIIIVLALVVGVVVGSIQGTPVVNLLPVFRLRPNIDLLKQITTQLPNMIINGLVIGFVYAVVAVGYTMVYGVLKFVNFAHSEVFMVGGFVGFEVISRVIASKLLPVGGELNGSSVFAGIMLIVLMIAAGMVFCGLLAVTIERIAYKPLRRAPRLVPLIAAIGVSFFLQDFMRAFAALAHNQFNLAYANTDVALLGWRLQLAPGVNIEAEAMIVIISAILMVLGLNYFVNGTRIGKGIRAVSQDQTTASLMGINVDSMITLTFLVGGALGGASGVLFGLYTTRINAYVGFIPGLKAFTAAVLGGIGNITGALLGGILLGLIEAFFSSILPYFPALGLGYTDIFAFAILIAILIFRPSGLLGKIVDEKV